MDGWKLPSMPSRKSLGIITSHDHPSTVSHRASGGDESMERKRQREDKSQWVEGGLRHRASQFPLFITVTESRHEPIRHVCWFEPLPEHESQHQHRQTWRGRQKKSPEREERDLGYTGRKLNTLIFNLLSFTQKKESRNGKT